MPELAFPEADRHFARRDGYQSRIIKAALPWCKGRNLAIDIGAHVGLLTRQMQGNFDHVVAFEPQPENFLCLKHNATAATLYNIALSNTEGLMSMVNPKASNSGAWECIPYEAESGKAISSARLDWFGLKPDFVKIDVQGHEARVIEGAVETLKAHKPVLAVECWRDGRRNNLLRDVIESLGYVMVDELRKDLIFAYPVEQA